MACQGVGTIDDLVAALGVDAGISKSEFVADLRRARRVGDHISTQLLHHHVPYVFLDPTYLHVRRARHLDGVVVATGVTASGGREILGLMWAIRRLRCTGERPGLTEGLRFIRANTLMVWSG